mmetsp:Transcript_109590/g.251323  ORF Transcript_109590/g.251323 Transcript_109590/m.251323 type:complete len:90 (+) Transcript_109590:1870-2139(+)
MYSVVGWTSESACTPPSSCSTFVTRPRTSPSSGVCGWLQRSLRAKRRGGAMVVAVTSRGISMATEVLDLLGAVPGSPEAAPHPQDVASY